MTAKTIVLITGANQGLGFEIVKALLRSSKAYHIVLGSRSLQRGEEAIQNAKKEFPDTKSEFTPFQVDIASDASIETAFKTVQGSFPRIDVLINNAGGWFDSDLTQGKVSMRDMWNKTWDVNVSGTHIFTHTFAPLLLASSDPRLVFITSGTSSLADAAIGLPATTKPPPKGWPKAPHNNFTAYRSAKAGMNMMMLEWTRILKEDGVKIWCIAPGFLATNLGGAGPEKLKELGAKDPAFGGEFVKDVVEGKRDKDVGNIVRNYGSDIQPW